MIQDFLKEIEECPDEPWIRLKSATWQGDGVNLLFCVDRDEYGEAISTWTVTASGVVEYDIDDVNGGGFHYVTDNHVAIRQYTDNQVSLYFRGTHSSVNELVGALWLAHRDLCDDWVHFDQYLNLPGKLPQLIGGGHGLLARGPSFLLSRYAAILDQFGIEARLSDQFPPKKFVGGGWVGRQSNISMVHFGNSFVIAEGFDATKHD